MSVNDPVVLVWNPRHEYFYLVRGTETFYDEDRVLHTWDDAAAAIRFAVTDLKVDSIQLPRLDAPWPEE